MNKARSQTCVTGIAPRVRLALHLKRLSGLVIVALLMALWPARAAELDDQYLQILDVVQQADALNTSGKAGPALAKYKEAQAALYGFQKVNPGWNVKVVSYRLNYLAGKIAEVSEKTAAPAGGAATTGTRETQAEGKTAASGAQVKLLEAGAEPRQVLRLHPKPDDKQTLSMILKTSITTKVGEMQTPAMKLPAVNFSFETTVKSVSPEGDITYEMVMGDASVTEEPGALPEVVAMMKSALGNFKGLSGTGVLSNRGLNKGLDFKAPAGADAQTRQMMDQMKEGFSNLAAPLPEEAVGAGARWEAKLPLKSQGMAMNQTTSQQLVSVEGDHLSLTVAIVQTAPKQKIESPAMPGMKVDLTKMAGTGKSEVTSDLTQVLPLKGTADTHTDMSMEMNAGGQKQAMSVSVDASVSFEAK